MNHEKMLCTQLSSKKRIAHSLSVAKHMQKYAPKFGIDPEQAYLAGIYHDIAKEWDSKKIIHYSKLYKSKKIGDIAYFNFKLKHPGLLHGAAGAAYVKTQLAIDDPLVLDAITLHTSGGRKLSRLAKFTFMFDYCEPLRAHSNSRRVYHLLINKKKFHKAYLFTYTYLLQYLLSNHRIICQESIDGYHDAILELEKHQS